MSIYKLAFCFILILAGEDAMATSFKMKISGFRTLEGSVAVSIFSEAEAKAFPGDAANATKTFYVKIDGREEVEIDSGDIPEGRYAVALMHDKDEDRKFKTFLGIPKEGFGFSNNPRVLVGAPSFDSAAFTPTGGETLDIKVRYIF